MVKFKEFKVDIENQLNLKIKVLQTDNGKEFKTLNLIFFQNGISHTLMPLIHMNKWE